MDHHACNRILVFAVLLLASFDLCNGALASPDPYSLDEGAGLITTGKPLVPGRILLSDVESSTDGTGAAYVLQAFRRALTDPNGALRSWNLTTNSNFCQWAGVTCSQAGNVSALNLAGKRLVGNISPSLGSLVSLLSLNLGNNNFSGYIPRALGSLQNLRFLNLSSNSLSGNIPVEISNCSSLVRASFSRNSLNGRIPSELGKLQNLSLLDLSANQLQDSIPRSLGNCSSLQYLSVFGNALSGVIPLELGNLRKLTYLNITFTNIGGQIPATLANCSLLETLQLNTNNLTGHIFPEIGSLWRLTTLTLDANFLTGAVPNSIGNLSSLTSLVLGGIPDGPLTGNLPPELGKLQNVQLLSISFSNITGNIPPQLGNMTNLEYMFLEANKLTGTIPESLGNLKNLQTLELDDNLLTGRLPDWIGNMRSVASMGLRLNQFTGGVPASFGNLTTIWRLLLSHNMLSGPFIPELGNLTKVGQLGLDNNGFTGELPSTVGNFVNMESLYLHNNFFSGAIPSNLISAMVNSFELHLSNNNFSGNIPREVGQMVEISTLDLSFNNLSGPIPDIEGCKGIRVLILSNNQLTGELPVRALEGMNLTKFSVAYNDLEGPVPASVGAFARFNATAYVGNAGLCGPLLGVSCSNTSSSFGGAACSGISISCHRDWFLGLMIGGLLVLLVSTSVVVVMGCLCHRKVTLSKFDGVAKDHNSDKQDGEDISDFAFSTYDFSKKLTVEELRLATDDFSAAKTIGVGGQSIVFKAVLPVPDHKVIAVKVLDANLSRTTMINQLFNEVKILANIRHRNLVSLYGFYTNPDIKALLVEYVPNGNLRLHLHPGRRHGNERSILGLESRLQIAVGVADALSYLHHECPVLVVHRDLKPSNILLDSDFNPKVSDFGISKYVKQCYENEVSASHLCGTIGYIPPEYAASNKVSTEGDVYSYGIVLLELLTGKCPTDDSFATDNTLVRWVSQAIPDRFTDVLDDALVRELPFQEEQLQMLLRVGLMCTLEAAKSRPSMREVQGILARVKDKGAASLLSEYPTWEQLAKQPTIELDHKPDNSKYSNDPVKACGSYNVSASRDRDVANVFCTYNIKSKAQDGKDDFSRLE